MTFRFLRYNILISFLLIKSTFVFSNDSNKDSYKLASEKQTENDLVKKSFIQDFLQSLKTKMYGNR